MNLDVCEYDILSRRRRAYIQCYVTDYSPGFFKCPGYGLLGLLGATSRPVTDIGIGPKSNWNCYVGSAEGPTTLLAVFGKTITRELQRVPRSYHAQYFAPRTQFSDS